MLAYSVLRSLGSFSHINGTLAQKASPGRYAWSSGVEQSTVHFHTLFHKQLRADDREQSDIHNGATASKRSTPRPCEDSTPFLTRRPQMQASNCSRRSSRLTYLLQHRHRIIEPPIKNNRVPDNKVGELVHPLYKRLEKKEQ